MTTAIATLFFLGEREFDRLYSFVPPLRVHPIARREVMS